jgi:hypothetical protein
LVEQCRREPPRTAFFSSHQDQYVEQGFPKTVIGTPRVHVLFFAKN